jgi:hypothetical protein
MPHIKHGDVCVRSLIMENLGAGCQNEPASEMMKKRFPYGETVLNEHQLNVFSSTSYL